MQTRPAVFVLGALLALTLPGWAFADLASSADRCPVSGGSDAERPEQGPITVGEEVWLSLESPEVRAPEEKGSRLVWVQELEDPGASYIAPHFSHFDLPDGSHLVVRAPDGSRRWQFRGHGKEGLAADDGFWGIHIAGDRAVVELHAAGPLPAGAVIIDRYARGFAEAFDPQPPETICSADDSREAKCYQSS